MMALRSKDQHTAHTDGLDDPSPMILMVGSFCRQRLVQHNRIWHQHESNECCVSNNELSLWDYVFRFVPTPGGEAVCIFRRILKGIEFLETA